MSKHFLTFLSLLLLFSCNTAKKGFYHDEEQDWQTSTLPSEAALEHTLFLAGDVGEASPTHHNYVLSSLKNQLEQAGENSTLVFLGDNVPIFNHNNIKASLRAQKLLNDQLDILKNHKGKTLFIPGENDWNKGKPDGRDALKWQEKFIEQHLDDKHIFLPGKACAEPQKIKISDDVRFLFVDSQWWLQDWGQIEDINRKCDIKDRFAFLQELEDDLKKYDKERVVLFMHHPFYSNGVHGGSFSWKHHLFPLTLWRKNLWLPLPGVGTLAVLARQVGASRQDVSNYRYARMKQEILSIANKKPENLSLIFAGAHDHSLQYFEDPNEKIKFVVSGSAGKATFARGGKNARFVQAERGFSKLYFYKNKEVWVEFIVCKNDGTEEVRFRKQVFDGVAHPDGQVKEETFEPLPDSMTTIASEVYNAGLFKKITFGDRYRNAWKTPVQAPVFNLEKEFANLTPIKQGGGMSSKSLRLEGSDGKQYVLRSVNKDVSKGLPKDLRETLVQDFIQDLKSGSHPYGAFAVPSMAEAAGVYHTNPQLFYLPAQKRLGAYNENFAGELYLFEERPNKKWDDLESFGNYSDAISYVELLEKLQKSPKHQLDEKQVLRSRLFDQLIHDYDRHDDQWRWGVFPQGDSLNIYRPVPRDRDQAFYDLRGIVPFLISRRFLALQQRGFTGKIHDIPGEAFPGHVFDRSFITELGREDWLAVAEEMQAGLTDSVIENAFKAWPSEIYKLNAPQIIQTLKRRRDRIPIHAEKLYEFQAKYVDVVGTEKRDLFELKYHPDGKLSVKIFTIKKNGSKKDPYYHRVFHKNETREVRLYGLDKEDLFIITGKTNKGIRVRVIGGSGDDVIEDTSETGAFSKRPVAYDTPDGMALIGNIRDLRGNNLKINEFDRNEFRYNRFFPLLNFGRTVDDGALYGTGVRLTNYRFRKKPYGVQHSVFVRFSANTNALNLYYTGDFVKVIGTLDFNPDLRFDRPIIFNYFGLGNGSVDDADNSQFNWVRLEKMALSPLLKKRWYNGRNFTRFGPFYERVEVENRAGRITDTDLFTANDLELKQFIGLKMEHSFEAVDNGSIPRNGLKFNFGATYYRNLNDKETYTRLFGSFTSYVTVGSTVELTFASRIGFAALSNNDFMFYHSNNLGGNSYMRGYRNNRFAGKSMFYHNTDLRLKLFYWRNRIIPFEFGVMGGFDYGRVWIDREEKDAFHTGISPGFWITPFKMASVSAFYTIPNGTEDDTYTIRVGFYF